MANYSKEEIAAFNRKDLLNSRMSAVKATSVNFEGKEVDFELFKEFSDKVFDWIRQDQQDTSGKSPLPDVEGDSLSLPTPTTEQKKVLDAIMDNTSYADVNDWDQMCTKVLKYSTEVAGLKVATYPKSMDSVDNIVNYIKGA